MPTYEYLCQSCDHLFEEFQSITAGALRKCPNCSKMKLKRLIGSGSGIIFKGSGFYQTDYRTKSYKDGKKNAKPSDTKKDKTSEKSEKKSEKKEKSKDKKKSP